MNILRFFTLLLLIFSSGHYRFLPEVPVMKQQLIPEHQATKGALISTRFKSLEELKKVIQIEYFFNADHSDRKPIVRLTHHCDDLKITSVLKWGIKESDIQAAKEGDFLDRVSLGLKSPYIVFKKNDLMRIFLLGRRIGKKFGEGDVAFYDLAENMVENIRADHLAKIDSLDLTEKGYLNSFNHITAQTFMTAIFSENLADFAADIHERSNMSEVITGKFTPKQLEDIVKGPIDNYVDIINNEWGQELGKWLKEKYDIDRQTHWTPELLTNYLNDIQSYYTWAFQISFEPFKTSDEVVVRYAKKINRVMNDVRVLKTG